MTAFQNPAVRFVNINTAEFDAYKVGAIPVVADARVALEQLGSALAGHAVSAQYARRLRN
jgi:3D-(3,5/4)-trihydroxycyclohexane-1,2-dione acylhydrolase (decyclizing)